MAFSFFRRAIPAAQVSQQSIDFSTSGMVNLLLNLDSKKDRKSQMQQLIDATNETAAKALPEFAYVPDPVMSSSGEYATAATIYDRKGGKPIAYVDLVDDNSGLVCITLRDDVRQHVAYLSDKLRENRFAAPDIKY